MKLAICISGHFRDYENKIQTLFDNILTNYDYDIFVHSWDNHGFSYQGVSRDLYLKDGFKKDSPQLNIESVLEKLKPKKYIFETYSDVENQIKEEASYFTRINPWENPEVTLSLQRKIYLCDRLRYDFEIETNTKYDAVIRTRPDLLFTRKINIQDYDLNYISMPEEESYTTASDTFAFANATLMIQYSSLYSNMKEIYHNTTRTFNPHCMLYEHLNQNKLNYKLLPMGIVIR